MNIFSVSTPNLASNEDSLLSGSALTPPADDSPAGSFAAVLGASSPATPLASAAGKKRGSKGAPLASGPANGNVNAAQFQRSSKTAPTSDLPTRGENAMVPGSSAESAETEGASNAGDHSVDSNPQASAQVILQNLQLNPLLLQQVVGEVPRADTAAASLSASADGDLNSSKDNLSEGLSGVGRINRSFSPGTAQSRAIEFGAASKPANGSAGLMTLSSGGSAAPMSGFSPVPGSKNTSLHELGNVRPEGLNDLHTAQLETAGLAAAVGDMGSNGLNLVTQTASGKTSLNNVKSALTQVDNQATAGQASRIGKKVLSSSTQSPDGPVLGNQAPLAQAVGADGNSLELLDMSEITAEAGQAEISRPARADGRLVLAAETNKTADIAVEVQDPGMVQETVTGTPESLTEQVVAPEGRLALPKQTAEIPVPTERSEFARNATRPNQNLASPPPQSIPRNLTRSPAIKSVTQLGVAARQNAGAFGPNAASRVGQSGITSKGVVPGSLLGAAGLSQIRTEPSSKVASSAESSITPQEGSALAVKAEAKGTTSVAGSLATVVPKEKLETISSRAGGRSLGPDSTGNRHQINQIAQEKGLRRSEVEGSVLTPTAQPSAVPVVPNGRPMRAVETQAKPLGEKETSGSRRLPDSNIESGSAVHALSEAHSLRQARTDAEVNGTKPTPVISPFGVRTSEMKDSSDKSSNRLKMELKAGTAVEMRAQKQHAPSSTAAQATSANQASAALDAAGIVKPLDSGVVNASKSSDQLNRDSLVVLDVPANSEAASSRADGRESDSMSQNHEETSGDSSGEGILSENEPQQSFPEIRRGFESSDSSSVLARVRSRDLDSANLQDSSPSSGGTLDAQHGSAMAFRANSETGNTTFGKNIPSGGKNDSLLGMSEQIVSRSELGLAKPEVSSQRIIDASLLVNSSALDASKVSDRGISDFEELGRVGHARLAGEVWTAVEKFRATSHQDWVVSIRPDQDTHLNLKMKLEDNQLLIQATLESGNWDVVAPHWPELQAAFADRGVQLKALEAGAGQNLFSPQSQFNQAGSGSNGQEHRQAAADLAYAREFFEMNHGLTRGRAETKKPAANEPPARSNRVLETWA